MGARRNLAVAITLLAACSAREPSAAEPAAKSSNAKSKEGAEQAPLVTIELGLVGDADRQRIAERLPGSSLAKADAILAVHHRIAEPWHIYWKNPGESGLSTRVELSGTGFVAGPILYPAPEQFVALGGQVSYGWARDAVLFVPLSKIAEGASLELRSDWLACHESCIPGNNVAESPIAKLETRTDPITAAMVERIPEPAGDRIQARWEGSKLSVRPGAPDIQITQFFPYAHDHAVVESTQIDDAAVELDYRLDGQPPAGLGQGVLAITQAGEARWLELAAPWPTP